MTDADLAAIAAGFKTVIEEQGIELRAQIAALREDLQLEKAKGAERRKMQGDFYISMAKDLGDAIGPLLRQQKVRIDALERAMSGSPVVARVPERDDLAA